ncbi:E3 ubiquitin-protein ligase RNF12-B, partial [Clonorchis sinensis]
TILSKRSPQRQEEHRDNSSSSVLSKVGAAVTALATAIVSPRRALGKSHSPETRVASPAEKSGTARTISQQTSTHPEVKLAVSQQMQDDRPHGDGPLPESSVGPFRAASIPANEPAVKSRVLAGSEPPADPSPFVVPMAPRAPQPALGKRKVLGEIPISVTTGTVTQPDPVPSKHAFFDPNASFFNLNPLAESTSGPFPKPPQPFTEASKRTRYHQCIFFTPRKFPEDRRLFGLREKMDSFPFISDPRGVQLSSFALISRVKKIQVDKLPTCPVCLVDYQENDLIITLPCFHVYHKACTGPWLKSDEGCAMCRLSPLDLIHNTKALLAQVAEEKRQLNVLRQAASCSSCLKTSQTGDSAGFQAKILAENQSLVSFFAIHSAASTARRPTSIVLPSSLRAADFPLTVFSLHSIPFPGDLKGRNLCYNPLNGGALKCFFCHIPWACPVNSEPTDVYKYVLTEASANMDLLALSHRFTKSASLAHE